MANFCNQCARDLGLLEGDLAGMTLPEYWSEGMARVAQCENCGVIHVDPEGNCATAECWVGITGRPHAVPWLKKPGSSQVH